MQDFINYLCPVFIGYGSDLYFYVTHGLDNQHTDGPLYVDTLYNDKIHYNDNSLNG